MRPASTARPVASGTRHGLGAAPPGPRPRPRPRHTTHRTFLPRIREICMRIEGISAVVTGGASGLGLGTVKRLAKAGANVVIVDLPGKGESVAAELGDNVRFAAADVTDEAQVRAAIALAAETGPVRAVVH